MSDPYAAPHWIPAPPAQYDRLAQEGWMEMVEPTEPEPVAVPDPDAADAEPEVEPRNAEAIDEDEPNDGSGHVVTDVGSNDAPEEI